MKKNFVVTLIVLALCSSVMTGCDSTTAQETDTAAETEAVTTETAAEETVAETETEAVEIANPWTESDKDGVLAATGFEMTAPDGASDISYSYMAEGALAQMCYTLDGAEWIYRIQMADALTDISGLSIPWSNESSGTVAGMDAMYYTYVSDDETANDVQLVNWYNMVVGVTYSLSVTGQDLNGIDLQTYANTLYAPVQGDATDDPEGDRETELNNYFLGEHIRSTDESSLTITDNGDGTFGIAFSIIRLCNLENGIGTFAEHKMSFTILDPSENELSGVIYIDSDNSLTIKITDSTWEYLPNDEILEGFGR